MSESFQRPIAAVLEQRLTELPRKRPMNMTEFRVPRRASRIDPESHSRDIKPLTDWRELDAYVLLGDPGAGKTQALQAECTATGGLWLTARNVVAGITPNDLEGKTVFIDGLDEVRATTSDGRRSFEAIRRWLHDHGRPRFRLSCREADWRGSNDLRHLAQIAPRGQVSELHLEPLADEDIHAIVTAKGIEAAPFVQRAEQTGLLELLRNPLLLDLMIQASAHDDSLRTRTALYEAACREMAREFNDEHLEATPQATGDMDRLLHDAGLLCAVLLVSGRPGIALNGSAAPDAVNLRDLPIELPLPAEAAALRSKIFTAEGGVAEPRHRTIAEFLAARALAQRIKDGLPLGRVRALMQGIDGVPVEPLRGLWAWLAVHHLPGRETLIAQDPLGFVLNGDAACLATEQRVRLLHTLHETAEKDPWLRNANWVSHPFGPLATADMAATYETLLSDRRRDHGHEVFMDCVFSALRHGQRMPSLAGALEAWIEASEAPSYLRVAAYRAWKTCVGYSAEKALGWSHSIEKSTLADDDDELCGTLLEDLYLEHVPPSQVLDHWHRPKRTSYIGTYRLFWYSTVFKRTPPHGFAVLADEWLRRRLGAKAEDDHDFHSTEFSSKLLAMALQQAGDEASDETLCKWLGICLDEHGFSRFEDVKKHGVQSWLSERPQRIKAVMALGLAATQPNEQGHYFFWEAETRLHGAQRPRDWFFWHLDQAASASTVDLARYCFATAAAAAIEPTTGVDSPSMDQVVAWVETHRQRWPEADKWLKQAWTMDIDHYEGKNARRRKQERAKNLADQDQRRVNMQPHLPSLLDGTAPPGLLYHVAREHGFVDVCGETPLERVRALLVTDDATAQAVIDALPRVLQRDDLPTVQEVIDLQAKGRQHYIRPAALLAARLMHEREPQAALGWSQELAERLVAYYLTGGTGNMPDWYRLLVSRKPEWVAPVLVRYATPRFRRSGPTFTAGLWALGQEDDHRALARLVLPPLLAAFPLRASKHARSTLNGSLLRALPWMEPDQAAAVVKQRLEHSNMDAGQRICWLVADLPYRADAVSELARMVGRNERRAVLLGAALHEQDVMNRVVDRLHPRAVAQLIELLAPITTPNSWERDGIVTLAQHRGDTVRSLFAVLSSDPRPESSGVLQALAQLPGLGAWTEHIRYCLRTHAVAVREASFRIPDAAAVAATLANSAPTNAADLRALVVQHLDDMVRAWRGSDTFALKQFWRGDPGEPKIENDCRDLILERLRDRLAPLNIAVGREASAAQDKRADMRAEFAGHGKRIALPIEVKKHDHLKLWTAWRDQLDRLYTNDPDAQGHGLYLVLWFGKKTTVHPEGLKPSNSEELRRAMADRISPADRYRLGVQVLDLSWPK